MPLIAHVKMTVIDSQARFGYTKPMLEESLVRFPAQGASLGLVIVQATHDPGQTLL